jgi:hypothetical protein
VTIGEQVKQYDEREGEGNFAIALTRCFLFGVVVKRSDFVLLAEEVFTDGKAIVGIGPDVPKNCWWIYYVNAPKGTITPCDFMAEAPYALPYVAFKRRGKIKIYLWDHIKKDVYGRSSASSSTAST